MPQFLNKVKNAIDNFHLPQPGVGPGLNGSHGYGSNECYTATSGNRWQENKRPAASGRGNTNDPRVSSSTAGRPSASS